MKSKPCLTLEDARRIAAAAEKEAIAQGWNVAIAIVDDGGYLVHFQRLDGTQLGSCDIALAKARTAALLRRPTKLIEEAIAGGRVAMLALPGATPIEGGLPLFHAGELVGAIGVSGVQSAQDGIVAAAGAAALGSGTA